MLGTTDSRIPLVQKGGGGDGLPDSNSGFQSKIWFISSGHANSGHAPPI